MHVLSNISVPLLLLGVMLQVVSDCVRTRGWTTIVRSATGDSSLRHRTVMGAYFGGAGINAFVPARGGDAVKIALLRRNGCRAPFSTLAATLATETLTEAGIGLVLLVGVIAVGLLPASAALGSLSSLHAHPLLIALVVLAAVALLVLLVRCVAKRWSGFCQRVSAGLALMRRPRDLLTGVVSWQVAARCVRLGAIACFLAAFGLPSTIVAVPLVMAVQGGTRVPLIGAGTPIQIALLAYGLPQATGHAVSAEELTTYMVGTKLAITAAGTLLSVTVLARASAGVRPRALVELARNAIRARDRAEKAAPAAEVPAG